MKYYIPTTTLNFNNILSSESISPSIFFQNRGFGYSRWFNIPENELANSIILYNSLSDLKRDDSELEDHPMIIEIITDEDYREIGNGVYTTDKTIYLNPWNTRFIFLNEQDKKVTLSLSDSSLETKMIRLYQKGFEIRYPVGYYPCIKTEVFNEYNSSEVNHDKVINRLKGLLYGYYIGALLSCEKSIVDYYNILKDLQNIFAAILSNPLREPTFEQEKKANLLISSLLFNAPVFKEIEAVVKDRDKVVEISSILNRYGYHISNVHPSFFFKELRMGSVENNLALNWITDELKRISSETSLNKKLLSPDACEIVVSENQLIAIKEAVIPNKVENQLFIGLINNILRDDSISGKISSQRAELTDKLTASARDILGNEWESSPIRTYLNTLRRHVRGEAFNQDWNNGVLSSLAAVILKGDDWEALLDFLKRKGMTDYRLAFAFYGAFNGFANLTRDFTDLLLNNESSYVASVYKEFYGSIHGRKIDVSSKTFEPEPIKERITTTSIKSFKDKVWDFYFSNVRKRKKNQSKLDEELKCALDKIGESEDGYVFVCVLNDYSMWGTKTKAWQEMQQEFCPDYENIRFSKKTDDTATVKSSQPKKNRGVLGGIKEALGGIFSGYEDDAKTPSDNPQSTLRLDSATSSNENPYSGGPTFQNNGLSKDSLTSRSIIYDDYAIDVIKTFLGVSSHKILDIFVKFQDSYRSGYYFKNQDKYKRNNSDVIDHFCNWCFHPSNELRLEKIPVNSRLLDGLKLYLSKYYRD